MLYLLLIYYKYYYVVYNKNNIYINTNIGIYISLIFPAHSLTKVLSASIHKD